MRKAAKTPGKREEKNTNKEPARNEVSHEQSHLGDRSRRLRK
jgi:hypothetical protein